MTPADIFPARIAAKVAVDPSGCWLWTGAMRVRDYGKAYWRGKERLAHRVAYEIANGAVDSDLCVCHHCDTPRCVNPAHLFLGTHLDNMRDRDSKGRVAHVKGSRHYKAKLTEADIRAIRSARGRRRGIDLAEHYGVTPTLVSMIQLRKIWKHVE